MMALMATTSTTGFALAAHNAREHTYQALEQPPILDLPPPASVSLIMKNLNEEAFIARCIESLLNQSIIKKYPDSFEILVVDGGSDDRSVEIAKQYPLRVMTTSKGILHQMNFGIENTTGDIIVFIDSDSYYPPYWLEKILEFLHDDNVSMVHTSMIDEDSGNYILPLANILRIFTMVAYGGGQAIRRTVFEATGLFDETMDCVYQIRVFTEAEMNITQRAMTVGDVRYQWDNPFITSFRRQNVEAIKHECIRDPNGPNCRYAMDVGVARF